MKNVVYIVTVTDTDLTSEPWVDVFTEREAAERYADELCDRFEKYGVMERMLVAFDERTLNDSETHLICADEVYGPEADEA